MNRLVLAALALAAVVPIDAQAQAQEPVVRVAYYYKVRWGFQEEFERLFFKNHRPILAAQTKSEGGRIRDVSFYRPQFHGDGRGDWTFLVVIGFANWGALKSTVDEAEIARGIFTDMETWRREEKRRFEIVEAHWDVPLVPVQPPR